MLEDIRQIFMESGVDRIRSKDLVRALCALGDSPWPKAHQGGKPITEMWLARALSGFAIKSQTLRVGDRLAKGYALADFKEAFARFLRES